MQNKTENDGQTEIEYEGLAPLSVFSTITFSLIFFPSFISKRASPVISFPLFCQEILSR